VNGALIALTCDYLKNRADGALTGRKRMVY